MARIPESTNGYTPYERILAHASHGFAICPTISEPAQP